MKEFKSAKNSKRDVDQAMKKIKIAASEVISQAQLEDIAGLQKLIEAMAPSESFFTPVQSLLSEKLKEREQAIRKGTPVRA